MKRWTTVIPIILTLFFCANLFGGEIRINGDHDEIQLFNSSNNKILNYVLLASGESLEFKTIAVDSIIIYSRIMGDEAASYNYKIINDDFNRIVTKTSKSSNSTKTLSGDKVSAFNSYKRALNSDDTVMVENSWDKEIMFKFVAKTNERAYKKSMCQRTQRPFCIYGRNAIIIKC